MPPSPTSPTPFESLESDLLAHLNTTHAIEDIHTTLLSSLQRLGWTEKIRRLSLELLRANRCERFDEVVEAVVASAQGRRHPVLDNPNSEAHNNNGGGDLDGVDGGFSFENVDVRIPKVVVEQGVRAIKDVLREVAVLEDEGVEGTTTGGGGDGTTGKKAVNGDTSPTKKGDKKAKQGKQVK